MATRPKQRCELGTEQLIADIRLKNRQTQIEIWTAANAAMLAGMVLGGLLVQIANMAAG